MYLDVIGTRICAQVDPDEVPDEDTRGLFRIYAVLALAKGGSVTLEDVHNAWVAWMAERDSDHQSLCPFEELDPETAETDRPFMEAIHEVARSIEAGDVS